MQLPESTVRIRLVGDELRRHRMAAGWKLIEASRRMGIDHTKLSRMEHGKYTQTCDEVAGLLALYGVTGEKRKDLLRLSREAEHSGLWQRNCSIHQRVATLESFESNATRLINFENAVIPGLLQTVPYAQALIGNSGLCADDVDLGKRVADRIHRQAVLRKLGAPDLVAIIAESALHNIVGDRTIMREQIAYLAEAVQRRNIAVRIVPASARSSAGHDGPFMRLHFRDRRGVVVLENRTSNLFLEDDEDLLIYNQVTARLLDVALGNEESVALLRDSLA